MIRKIAFLLALGCTGCSSARFYYKSTETSPLTPRSVPGYTYDIESAKGHGELRVAPLGVRKLPAVSDRPVFVVRYYVDNKSKADWKIELANQLIIFGAKDLSQSPIASGLSSSQSALIAQAGKTQVFDMVYATPSDEPASFDFDWKLTVDGQAQGGHLEFYRAPIPTGGLQGYFDQPVIVNSTKGRR